MHDLENGEPDQEYDCKYCSQIVTLSGFLACPVVPGDMKRKLRHIGDAKVGRQLSTTSHGMRALHSRRQARAVQVLGANGTGPESLYVYSFRLWTWYANSPL